MAFKFDLFISGLVVLTQRNGIASVVAVRTEHHPHTATLAYGTSAIAGLLNAEATAPDPLVVNEDGNLFARRVLEDEVLWLEPRFDGASQPLEVDAGSLLRLQGMDPRAGAVEDSVLGREVSGTPAIARLDFAQGRVSVDDAHELTGNFEIRAEAEAPETGTPLPRLATALRLELEGLDSLVIHSNRRPAIRFISNETVRASFTNEPVGDFVPGRLDPFPHIGMAYAVTRFAGGVHGHHPGVPSDVRRPFSVDPSLTIKDRACPPTGG